MEKHFKQLIIARRDLNMSPGSTSIICLPHRDD
nr:MAG TPA: peptidyl-tRNA hydrolase [Caudoviricetes sp.]